MSQWKLHVCQKRKTQNCFNKSLNNKKIACLAGVQIQMTKKFNSGSQVYVLRDDQRDSISQPSAYELAVKTKDPTRHDKDKEIFCYINRLIFIILLYSVNYSELQVRYTTVYIFPSLTLSTFYILLTRFFRSNICLVL